MMMVGMVKLADTTAPVFIRAQSRAWTDQMAMGRAFVSITM